jgi:hypothetical protein
MRYARTEIAGIVHTVMAEGVFLVAVQGSVILRAAQQRSSSALRRSKRAPAFIRFLASIPSGAPIRVVRHARNLNDPVFLRVLASYA